MKQIHSWRIELLKCEVQGSAKWLQIFNKLQLNARWFDLFYFWSFRILSSRTTIYAIWIIIIWWDVCVCSRTSTACCLVVGVVGARAAVPNVRVARVISMARVSTEIARVFIEMACVFTGSHFQEAVSVHKSSRAAKHLQILLSMAILSHWRRIELCFLGGSKREQRRFSDRGHGGTALSIIEREKHNEYPVLMIIKLWRIPSGVFETELHIDPRMLDASLC